MKDQQIDLLTTHKHKYRPSGSFRKEKNMRAHERNMRAHARARARTHMQTAIKFIE